MLEQPQILELEKFAEDYQEYCPMDTRVLKQGFEIHDLQKYRDHARKVSGIMRTLDPQSYFDYVESRQEESSRFKSRTFVNANDPEAHLQAITILNFGTNAGEETAGHQDDQAVLALNKDPMFTDFMQKLTGIKFSTLKFAEALETYLGTMPISSSVVDAQTLLDTKAGESSLAYAIQAFRNLKVTSNQTSNVAASQFKTEESDMAVFEAEAAGGQLPSYLLVDTPLYVGLEFQTVLFKVKMHQVKEEDKFVPYFELIPIALKHNYLKAGLNFQELIRHKLPTESVVLGTWQ